MARKNKMTGAIPGAGRKPKYGEPTITIAFRIPESKKEEVKKIVNNFIKKFAN